MEKDQAKEREIVDIAGEFVKIILVANEANGQQRRPGPTATFTFTDGELRIEA